MRKFESHSKPIRSKCSEQEFATVAARDTNAYRSVYKRQPLATISKYQMIQGVPHKLVAGQFQPLTSKLVK